MCYSKPKKIYELKTHSKKAKKYIYTKDYKEQPREICDQYKNKSLKPVWVKQDRLVCTYGPKEISAMVFTKRKEIPEAFLGKEATHEVCGEVQSSFEGEDFSETLTRAKFEEMNRGLFKDTLEPIQKVHEDADLAKKEIDELVPVGSPTRIPTVQSHFGGYPGGRLRNEKERWGII